MNSNPILATNTKTSFFSTKEENLETSRKRKNEETGDKKLPPVTGQGTQHVPANKIQLQVHSLYNETKLFINTS